MGVHAFPCTASLIGFPWSGDAAPTSTVVGVVPVSIGSLFG